MKKVFVLVLGLVGCGEMMDSDKAVQAAESSGLSDVHVTGQHGIAPQMAGCAKDDAVAFDVEGKNAAGKHVRATVCCGLVLKGCTVRY